MPRLPSPEQPKTFAMPANDGLWLYDDQHVAPIWQDPGKDHPQHPICRPQRRPRRGPPDRGELVAKRQAFQLEQRAATKAVAEHRKEAENDLCIHAPNANQHRHKIPGFLPPMRFLGTTPHRDASGRPTEAAVVSICAYRPTRIQGPATNAFLGHVDTTLGQKILDIAKTERESEVQPNSVLDNLRRKAMPASESQ